MARRNRFESKARMLRPWLCAIQSGSQGIASGT